MQDSFIIPTFALSIRKDSNIINNNLKYKIMAKENLSTAEKMRRAVNWLDYMNEDFNDHFKDANSVIKVWENCNCDMVDDLWADLKPDEEGWVDEDVIHDAKLVNEAFGMEYYPIPKSKK